MRLSIFEYLDYRDLLKDAFEKRKAADPGYSYRRLGEELGIDTGNVFRVLEKAAQLPARCQSRALEFLGLSGREAEYFVLLSAYARERAQAARQEILEKAMALRDVVRRQLEENELSYLRDWWIAAVRAELEIMKGRAVPRELAAFLKPEISEASAAAAVELLKELGFVRKVSSERLELVDAHLTAGTGSARREAVRHYQRQVLALASEALERFAPPERDISTLALTVDAGAFAEVQKILCECRRQIQKCVEDVRTPDRVMQLAMAFFPLTDVEGKP